MYLSINECQRALFIIMQIEGKFEFIMQQPQYFPFICPTFIHKPTSQVPATFTSILSSLLILQNPSLPLATIKQPNHQPLYQIRTPKINNKGNSNGREKSIGKTFLNLVLVLAVVAYQVTLSPFPYGGQFASSGETRVTRALGEEPVTEVAAGAVNKLSWRESEKERFERETVRFYF